MQRGADSSGAVEFVRQLLDPHGERSALGLWWPEADPRPWWRFGLGGSDPTAL